MEKHLELYATILRMVGQTKQMNDIRNTLTFAWLVVGLCVSKTLHLGQWGLQRESRALAAGRERQIARWLHNPKIKADVVYRDLVTAALLPWAEQTAVLALDSSVLWEKYVIVRISLIYRGRALPLAWKVLALPCASVGFSNYAPLLTEVSRLLPAACQVVLLADRGFVDVYLLQLVVQLGWHFTIRAKGNLAVQRAFKPRCKVSALVPPRGEIRLLHTIQVTERRFGPVHLVLAHVRTIHGYEVWALMSDLPTSLEALARLCLVLAVATLYLTSLGTAIVTLQRRHLVDAHCQRGLSYFQIGWRYLTRTLARGGPLLTGLWLDPAPDPEPVYASKKQARTPTAAFSYIYCDD